MRPLSWWFPGHLGAVVGTAGLALLAYFLSLPRSDHPAETHPALAGFVIVAALGWLALTLVAALRLWRDRPALASEFFDPARGGLFFFAVLAPCIVGLGLLTYVPESGPVLPWLWGFAALLWLALALAWSIGLVFRPKPALGWHLITPAWLLPGASLHALVLLRLALDPAAGRSFGILAAFCGACALVLLATLALLARWLGGPLDPQTFGPSQWINLGAMGISTLCAAQLSAQAPARLHALLNFGEVFFWTLGLAWLPLLLAAGVWRHLLRRVPLVFVPENWALVFSPAVFGVATLQLPAVGAGEWVYPAAALAFCFSASCWALNASMSARAWRGK